jgi:hypothetical protein
MSQEVENELKQGAPIDEVKQYSQAEVEKMIAESNSGLKSKVDELLGEKKSASQKAREAEERLAREAEQRAKEQNDFKSLYESSEKARLAHEKKIHEMHSKNVREKVESESMRLALSLADGDRAELLSSFLKPRITFSDDGLIVLDEKGQPTVSTIDDLKKEFMSNSKYDSLLRHSKANGGSASSPSASGISGKTNVLNMSKQEKLEYFRAKRG